MGSCTGDNAEVAEVTQLRATVERMDAARGEVLEMVEDRADDVRAAQDTIGEQAEQLADAREAQREF